MNRQEANLKILWRLSAYIMNNPDQRFGQILANLGIVKACRPTRDHTVDWQNGFYEESIAVLERVQARADK